jgi:UPF0176 protein
MQKVILYYKFVPVPDPAMTMRWQRELCVRLGLKGRVIISPHGINGTLGGDIENLREYKREMNRSITFKGITYKWSDGSNGDFPKLSIKVRDELVAFHAADEIVVTERGIQNGGVHLKPEQVHELIRERGAEVIFFDGRNAYEAKIGRFRDALIPAVRTTPDFLRELEDPKYDAIKHRPIITYCTGGIRCEILSVLMKNRGFQEVYQIDGGIVKYGEKFGDDGFWDGTLYIFDGRMTHQFSSGAKHIGQCEHCDGATSHMTNCTDKSCNRLHVACESCHETYGLCGQHQPVAS